MLRKSMNGIRIVLTAKSAYLHYNLCLLPPALLKEPQNERLAVQAQINRICNKFSQICYQFPYSLCRIRSLVNSRWFFCKRHVIPLKQFACSSDKSLPLHHIRWLQVVCCLNQSIRKQDVVHKLWCLFFLSRRWRQYWQCLTLNL